MKQKQIVGGKGQQRRRIVASKSASYLASFPFCDVLFHFKLIGAEQG
jgi:hypothetical protein